MTPSFAPAAGRALLAAALALAMAPAQAGRPLSTDDASTDDAGQCHVEAWAEREGEQHALVVSPSCAVAPGLELAAQLVRPRPRHGVSLESELAVKWVPGPARLDTALGPARFGLRVAASHRRAEGGGWALAGPSALLIASLAPGETLALHANLGWHRDRAAAAGATLLNLAAVWTPGSAGLLFAEVQASDRSALDGPPLRSVGARAWLVPDRLGLDLTAARSSGSAATRWTLGFGWYGLGL